MDKLNSTEVMLAELIEQNNKQQKDVASMKTSLDTLSGELTKLNNILSPTLKPVKFDEVIPRKDADERAKFLVRMYGDMQAKYANLKAEFGELQAKTRYWASNQWAKHLFRWLFVKRHVWFFFVFLIYGAMMAMLIYVDMRKNDEINRLQEANLKYRYIRAANVAPLTMNWVDSLFETKVPSDMEYIHTTINEYESVIKHKCDSVVKAENQKRARYK